MPRRRAPQALHSLAMHRLADLFHQLAMLPTDNFVDEYSQLVPANRAQQLLGEVMARAAAAQPGQLTRDYCTRLSWLMSSRTPELVVRDTGWFKESLEHLEASLFKEQLKLLDFLGGVSRAGNLRLVDISREAAQIGAKALRPPVAEAIAFGKLTVLKLPGVRLIYHGFRETNRLLAQLSCCRGLRCLEIPGAALDNDCLKELLCLKSLHMLNVDHCKLNTIMVVQLLTGLPNLLRLDCVESRQSKVVQALSALPDSSCLLLQHLTWRQPPRPPLQSLSRLVPCLSSALIVYNVFEVGYSAAIDDGLIEMTHFESLRDLRIEISTINMLYVIQLGPKLELIAELITRIELTEAEFLHPACLEPVAVLPRLTHLTIINPSVIGDDMFLELPELTTSPFPSLKFLQYEGSINESVVHYMTVHSPHLISFILKAPTSVLDPFLFKNFHIYPKSELKDFKVELTVSTSGADFIAELERILEVSHSLESLGNCNNWGNVQQGLITNLEQTIRAKNWDLQLTCL